MATRDYYAEAQRLATRLAEEGFDEWARRLEEAITSSFTATEILMALRWQARQLLNAKLPLTSETNSQLKSLVAAVDEILG